MPAPQKTAILDMHLPSLGALFNALDPSPFVERDLDDNVEAYLVDYVQDVPKDAALTLRLHVPADAAGGFDAEKIGEAVGHYFDYMRAREARRLHHLLREGRWALLAGIAFLAVCTVLGQVAIRVSGGTTIGHFLQEGLLIIGWVANWRPVEIFLYEWQPMRRMTRIYAQLSAMSVEILPLARGPLPARAPTGRTL